MELSTEPIEQIANWETFRKLIYTSIPIGSGGSGHVFKVQLYHGEGYICAIKRFQRDDGKNSKKAYREIEILKSIESPFIVQQKTFFHTKRWHYSIMQYINGPSASALLQRAGKMSDFQVYFFIRAGIDCIDALHGYGIISRDIKLDHFIFPLDEKFPLLIDLGSGVYEKNRTRSICGTYAYISPWALMGTKAHKKMDWWSFGVCIYELCAGRLPFEANSVKELHQKIKKRKTKWDLIHNKSIKDFIKKCFTGSTDISFQFIASTLDWKEVFKYQVNCERFLF